MRENFLHFLWRWRRFQAADLRTTEGQTLEILHPGEYNTHAGPDFFNARLRLGDTLWAGNVEIHLRASEWLAHRHDEDTAYDNVILHVVLEEDRPIAHARTGRRLATLELRGRIPPKILETYHRLEHERLWVPCANFLPEVPGIVLHNWLDRLLVERLEEKTASIAQVLAATGNHWEETFYRMLAHSFGLKVNAEPFGALAHAVPLLLLAKYRNHALQIEALLFGQAGLLDSDFADPYPKELAREYRHLRHKHALVPLNATHWKFLRLRPANFPTVRLAQFAALMSRSVQLFDQMLETRTLQELENLFLAEPNAYWLTHFQFDKPSAPRRKLPGRDFLHLLVINTIAPFLFHYGKTKGRSDLQQRAFELLEALPPEANTITDNWGNLRIPSRNAYQSQALIHLKTRYCDAKRCLECAVGTALLKG